MVYIFRLYCCYVLLFIVYIFKLLKMVESFDKFCGGRNIYLTPRCIGKLFCIVVLSFMVVPVLEKRVYLMGIVVWSLKLSYIVLITCHCVHTMKYKFG